ncbi:spore protease YyaC [Clostridiaceae bacterium UIB06]|nr:spore protease YyaC [Clostridiaceae bacterium UIB06]
MYKVHIDIKEDNIIDKLAGAIEAACFSTAKNYAELVVVCIGTDRNIGDSLGPLTGMFLSKYNSINFSVYGTLEHPIHALNINERLEEIKENHKNALFIGIDSILGSEYNLYKFIVKDSPVKPGVGVGKILPEVGDISVNFIIELNDYTFSTNKVRLNDVYNASKMLSQAVYKSCNNLASYCSQ